MSARNVILAVIGLAVAAGGAAYFMMKGANAPQGSAEETPAPVENDADTSPGAVADDVQGSSEAATSAPADEIEGSAEMEETPDAAADDLDTAPDGEALEETSLSDEDAADGLTGDVTDFVNDGEEEVDESLDEIPELPEERADEPNN